MSLEICAYGKTLSVFIADMDRDPAARMDYPGRRAQKDRPRRNHLAGTAHDGEADMARPEEVRRLGGRDIQ